MSVRDALCVTCGHGVDLPHKDWCALVARDNRADIEGSYNAYKTHCPEGHEYTDENTYEWGGSRNCKACHRARSAA